MLDLGPRHRRVFEDAFVDETLDIRDLAWCKSRAAEVECQFVGTDIGTLLDRVLADDLVQSPMEQVGDRVVALDRLAARAVHCDRHVAPNCRDILIFAFAPPSVTSSF